jgi:sugar phosphate permease
MQATDDGPDRQAKIGLAFLLLIGFINYIDRAAFGVLQVPIKSELQLSDSQMGILTGLAFFIPYSPTSGAANTCSPWGCCSGAQ